MPRLFVAIDLSDAVKESILLLQNGLRGAKWVACDNLHLTLRFIGEVPDIEADDIHSALSKIRGFPFVLKLGGVGVFSSGSRPRSIWIAVEDRSAIDSLKCDIDRALVRLGFSPDGRKYIPHVTVARLKGRTSNLSEFVTRLGSMRSLSVEIDQFTLFSSFLARAGPIYTPEMYYPLTAVPNERVLNAE